MGVGAERREISACLVQIAAAEDALKRARNTLVNLCAEDDTADQSCVLQSSTAANSGKTQQPQAADTGATSGQKAVAAFGPERLIDQAVACTVDDDSDPVTPLSPAACRHRPGANLAHLVVKRREICGGRITVPILNPEHAGLIMWNLVGFVFIIYLAFMIPLELAFNVESDGTLLGIASIIDVYFIADVLLNFLTAYFVAAEGSTERHIVTKLGMIAYHYSTSWLVCDLLASIPWDWIEMDQKRQTHLQLTKELRLLRIMRVIRLFRFMRKSKITEEIDIVLDGHPALIFSMGILRLLFFISSITHWAACLWYAMGTLNKGNSWVDAHLKDTPDWKHHYVYSVYFTLTTMTTVGYGDIVAQNFEEVCFVLLLLLIASIVFAALMGVLTDLIRNMNTESNALAEKRRTLSQYMRWRALPHDLFLAVRQHLLFMWESEGYTEFEQGIKDHLTPILRKELCYHIYGEALRSAPFLGWMSNYDACLRELASKVQSLFLSTGDYIFRVGDPNDKLYMVNRGTAHLTLNENLFTDIIKYSHQTMLLGIPEHLRSRTETAMDSTILVNATLKLRKQEQRLEWAARQIQRRWKNNQLHKPRSSTRSQSATMRSKIVDAPTYMGESCLWTPFATWGTEAPPEFKYSARCETTVDLTIIPRAVVGETIQRFSPWLLQNLEDFQEAVLEGLAKAEDERGGAAADAAASAPKEVVLEGLAEAEDERGGAAADVISSASSRCSRVASAPTEVVPAVPAGTLPRAGLKVTSSHDHPPRPATTRGDPQWRGVGRPAQRAVQGAAILDDVVRRPPARAVTFPQHAVPAASPRPGWVIPTPPVHVKPMRSKPYAVLSRGNPGMQQPLLQ